jgi:hypothetical protein
LHVEAKASTFLEAKPDRLGSLAMFGSLVPDAESLLPAHLAPATLHY